MEKKNGVFIIEEENGMAFSVQKYCPYIEEGWKIRTLPKEVVFLVENIDPEADLTEGKDLILTIGMNEAKELIKVLADFL